MESGDLVRNKEHKTNDRLGLFMGLRTFENGKGGEPYTCAEVMWFDKTAPNGDVVSTVQASLLEVISPEEIVGGK